MAKDKDDDDDITPLDELVKTTEATPESMLKFALSIIALKTEESALAHAELRKTCVDTTAQSLATNKALLERSQHDAELLKMQATELAALRAAHGDTSTAIAELDIESKERQAYVVEVLKQGGPLVLPKVIELLTPKTLATIVEKIAEHMASGPVIDQAPKNGAAHPS